MVRLTHCETGVVVVVDEVTADTLGPGWVLPEEVPAAPEEVPAAPEETEGEAGTSAPPEKGRGKGAHVKSDG